MKAGGIISPIVQYTPPIDNEPSGNECIDLAETDETNVLQRAIYLLGITSQALYSENTTPVFPKDYFAEMTCQLVGIGGFIEDNEEIALRAYSILPLVMAHKLDCDMSRGVKVTDIKRFFFNGVHAQDDWRKLLAFVFQLESGTITIPYSDFVQCAVFELHKQGKLKSRGKKSHVKGVAWEAWSYGREFDFPREVDEFMDYLSQMKLDWVPIQSQYS